MPVHGSHLKVSGVNVFVDGPDVEVVISFSALIHIATPSSFVQSAKEKQFTLPAPF
jgi:hypothetical protein